MSRVLVVAAFCLLAASLVGGCSESESSLCGGIVYISLLAHVGYKSLAVSAAVLVTLGLRLSAIKWKISLPVFVSYDEKAPDSKENQT